MVAPVAASSRGKQWAWQQPQWPGLTLPAHQPSLRQHNTPMLLLSIKQWQIITYARPRELMLIPASLFIYPSVCLPVCVFVWKITQVYWMHQSEILWQHVGTVTALKRWRFIVVKNWLIAYPSKHLKCQHGKSNWQNNKAASSVCVCVWFF